MAKKTKNDRELEILNYRITKDANRLQFFIDHGLSQKKIDKLTLKNDNHKAKRVKVNKKKKK